MENELKPDIRNMIERSDKIFHLLELTIFKISRQFCYLPQKKETKASSYATPRSVQKKKFF